MNMMMASFTNAYQHISSLWLFIFSITLQVNRINSVSSAEIEKHLELGRELLSRGQLTDALSHYHAAVEGDPTNYLTYFKRATVYLALAKSRSALPDLNKVIELKPDFTAAKIQRGLVLLKQGNLDEAHIDFEQVLQREPHHPEAIQHYNSIEPIKRDIDIAYEYMQDRNYFHAIDLLTRVLEVCPWNAKLREMRAECYEEIGDLEKAIHDIKPTTKLRNDNTEAYLKLSELYYRLGEAEDSLNEIRECLKLDPDHKDCFPFYKKVKKLASQIKTIKEYIGEQRYDDCVAKTEQMLKLEPHVKQFVLQATSQKCHCLVKGNKITEAIDQCTEAINIEENAFNLCDRADAFIANEQYEEAVQDYQRAVNLQDDLKRAHEGLSRAQKLLKQSKKRDYYKILGVRRTAGKREILKAYRKLAQKWHPDNFQGEEKKKAENKFIDIASAKEVLTNPEKREKYDNGEDPLDPESQAGQGFNPFGQGFHPFGGGPFQFKFHFN